MMHIASFVRSFLREEEGATMVEYALLIVLIALVAGVGALLLGKSVNTRFSNVASCVSQTGSSATNCS